MAGKTTGEGVAIRIHEKKNEIHSGEGFGASPDSDHRRGGGSKTPGHRKIYGGVLNLKGAKRSIQAACRRGTWEEGIGPEIYALGLSLRKKADKGGGLPFLIERRALREKEKTDRNLMRKREVKADFKMGFRKKGK